MAAGTGRTLVLCSTDSCTMGLICSSRSVSMTAVVQEVVGTRGDMARPSFPPYPSASASPGAGAGAGVLRLESGARSGVLSASGFQVTDVEVRGDF